MILEQLQETDLQCDIKKCKFHITEIMYLNLIISHNMTRMMYYAQLFSFHEN